MALIKSIAGVRGTIGGKVGESLTPLDIVQLAAAFGTWARNKNQKNTTRIVLGRDGRPSGSLVRNLVSSTLQALGISVIDLDYTTTPTLSLATVAEKAQGGVMISASHNPPEWNALKLLQPNGEYITATDLAEILELASQQAFRFAPVDALGTVQDRSAFYPTWHAAHVAALLLVDAAAIQKRKLRVVVDVINSSGSLYLPPLLQALGVVDFHLLHTEPMGAFAHPPEPVPENLTALCQAVQQGHYDLGLAVDPDVDRLAIVDEKGQPWGEDYTLVAVADYVLRHTPGDTVSHLSSSNALQDVTAWHGGQHTTCRVGERHVVDQMKATGAVIGGEGNGGVIYPPSHYGRDALVGIGLLLSHLAQTGLTASALRQTYPNYYITKQHVPLAPDANLEALFAAVEKKYPQAATNKEDGLKLCFENGWLHLRTSNTEPILRLQAEATTLESAEGWVQAVRDMLQDAPAIK